MTPTRVLNALRAFFLVLTVATFATALVWNYQIKWVRGFDTLVLKTYLHFPRKDYLAGRDAARAGDHERGVRLLERALKRMDGAKRGDRLEDTFRSTVTELAQAHEAQGDLMSAVEATEALVEFDPQDVKNNLYRAGLLCDLGRLDEARAAIEEAAAVDRHAEIVLAAQRKLALAAGDAGLAARSIIAELRVGYFDRLKSGWQLFRSMEASGDWSSTNLAPRSSADLPENRFETTVDLSDGSTRVARVRLDLPSRSNARIADLTLTLRTADGGAIELSLEQVERLKDLELANGRLVGDGVATDAYVTFTVPDNGVECVGIDVQFSIESNIPAEVLELVRDHDISADRASLVRDFGEDAVRRFEQMKEGE